MRNYMDQMSSLGNGAVGELASEIQDDTPDSAQAFNPLTGLFSAWQSAFREAASAATRNMEVARTTLENAASAIEENANQAIDDAVDETVEAMTAARERRSTAHAHASHGSRRNHK